MHSRERIRIIADLDRNVVQVFFIGDVKVEDVQSYEIRMGEILAKTPRGFYLLTDLSALHSMDILCAPHIDKLMELIRNHGVARIVRVIPDRSKDIGLNIMSLFHYPHSIHIITCNTRAEAEAALK